MDRTLLKGLALLELLARDGPRGITQLATEMKLEKSNVHRTLKTLVAAGFARQLQQSSMYDCTFKLFELGCSISRRLDVRSTAEPYMADLLHATAESVHLSVLDGGDVVYLHKLDSPHPIRAYTMTGGRAPAYCVATGKALLAHSGDVRQRFPEGLAKHTDRTITGYAELERELSAIRTQGFAVNRGEWREGVNGVAAPILDATRAAVAAIGISGPASRFPERQIKALSKNVIEAARAISISLGYPNS
jgi:IclR family transcriptional regulator, KDG regulon repressor